MEEHAKRWVELAHVIEVKIQRLVYYSYIFFKILIFHSMKVLLLYKLDVWKSAITEIKKWLELASDSKDQVYFLHFFFVSVTKIEKPII